LTIIITTFFFKEIITHIYKSLSWLYAIKFDVMPIITAYQFQIDYLDLPYNKYFIAFIVIAMGLFVMVYSYRIIGDKITNHGKTFMSLSFYLLIYSFFLSFVWIYIAFQMVTKGKTRW